MTWPVYNCTEDSPPALRRWARRETQPGPAGQYSVAADVWRDGVHLWRSWEHGETCDDWSERVHGTLLRDHDNGPWAVPGLADIGQWSVPRVADVAYAGSAQNVSDLIATLFAIGQHPDPPDLSAAPSANLLHVRLSREGGSWTVWAGEAGGVAVRVLLVKGEKSEADDAPRRHLAVRLVPRTVKRSDALDHAPHLERREETITVPADLPERTVVSRAKAALGLTGWQMQRLEGSSTWRLARAPWAMTIEEHAPVDGGHASD